MEDRPGTVAGEAVGTQLDGVPWRTGGECGGSWSDGVWRGWRVSRDGLQHQGSGHGSWQRSCDHGMSAICVVAACSSRLKCRLILC